MHWLFIIFVVLLAGCSGGGGSSPPPIAPSRPAQISMSATAWSFAYSAGVNGPEQLAQGWKFTIPDCGGSSVCHVNYLTTASPVLTGKTLRASLRASGSKQYVYKLKPDNTCDSPATARLYVQQSGDNMSGTGPYEFYRWWAPAGFVLSNGSAELSVPISPDKWTSVFGKSGTDALSGFQTAMANPGRVGLTFGGGCFYGHGINVIGSATFEAMSISAN